MVKFHTEEGEGFTLVKFELEGAIGPEELRTMTPQQQKKKNFYLV